MQNTQEPRAGIDIGSAVWSFAITLVTGFLGVLIAVFGDKRKRGSRLVGVGTAVGAWVLIIIIAVAAAGGSNSSKSSAAASSDNSTPSPTYKLSVTQLTCSADSIGERVCNGVVTNISPKTITDLQPTVHWIGGTDSDFGSIDINPLLPGQSSPFSVTTIRPNPALTSYRVGFAKPLGSERDFPVQPPS